MTQQSEKSERVKFASQLPPDLLKSMKAAAKADGKLQFSFNATDSAFEIVPQTFTWELASTDNIAIVQQNFLDLMAECRIEHLYLLHNPLGENENIPTYAQALKLEGHNPFFSNVN